MNVVFDTLVKCCMGWGFVHSTGPPRIDIRYVLPSQKAQDRSGKNREGESLKEQGMLQDALTD